jgi:hypothetical protein
LKNNRSRLVVFHDPANSWLEDSLVALIVDTVAEREVDRIVLASADSNVSQLSGPWEVLAVLVEGHGHDSVCRVEGFFNTVAMMDIDVDVENARVESEELENAEDDVYSERSVLVEPRRSGHGIPLM